MDERLTREIWLLSENTIMLNVVYFAALHTDHGRVRRMANS